MSEHGGASNLRIGQLAKHAGVSADTIRYYEKLGLLPKPPRSGAGYRLYTGNAVERVRLVRNALQFGFSLKEIGAFLGIRQAGGAPCKSVRAAGARILEAIEHQIDELTKSRQLVRRTLDEWDQRLSQTPEGRPAYLLSALPLPGEAPVPTSRPRQVGLRRKR